MLQRYKARQFVGIMMEAEVMTEFDVGLYFVFVEKMVVVGLLDRDCD